MEERFKHSGEATGLPNDSGGPEPWPFTDPRVAGVQEHFERVKFFVEQASNCSNHASQYRLRLAAVYSARAVVELIFEVADKDQLHESRDDLKARLSKQLPWYDLIERIRIHDFHRFGLVPPDPRFKVMMQRGPINLRAQKGAALYQITASGPVQQTTGSSRIQEQRPLLTQDGQFFDEPTRQYVSLNRILEDFIGAAQNVVDTFRQDLGSTSQST